MLADEGAVRIWLGQGGIVREGEAERGDMAGKRIIRRDRLLHHVRLWRMHPLVHMVAVIAPGPSIEATFLHQRHVIRHEIGTELVALVDDGPQFPCLGMEIEPVGIAQARGINARRSRFAVHLPDRGSALLGLQPAFRRIGIGADGGVEITAVRAER